MEIREESSKFLYENDKPVAILKQNGTLKVYKLIEVTYGSIDELFNTKPVNKLEENIWAAHN